MDPRKLRLHHAVRNLAWKRPCHKACRKCCARFRKAVQETTRRWIRMKARARNHLRMMLVAIEKPRRRPVQRARTLCLRHLQDRSEPKPKLRRRWCERKAMLPTLPPVQWRTNLIFLQDLLQAAGSLRTNEVA